METVNPITPGLYLWVYPEKGPQDPSGGWPDATKIADDLRSLGVQGVIPHTVEHGALDWLTPVRASIFHDAGLNVAIGIGSRGPHRWSPFADAISAVLDAGLTPVADWEWSYRSEGDAATSCVDSILHRHADAAGRVVDCPMWTPVSEPNGNPSRMADATRAFGKICLVRWVQAYGAAGDHETPEGVVGRSARMLAWSRSTTQYPACGTPVENIRCASQLHSRTLNDHISLLLAEPDQMLWQWSTMDGVGRLALKVVKVLRDGGFTGAHAVRAYQQACGLTADEVVGQKTLKAMGLG